ncbi:MAG: M16 family metallopeptidase [Acidobacteriota bacterium]
MGESFRVVAREGELEEAELASNGLRVLLLPDASVPVASLCIVYHVGSRNEAVGHTGATHLLEHLLFKGSRKFDPRQGRPVARTLERVGASFNATTWLDRTNYYETLPVEHLELAVELEADRMRHALLRADDLASELTVVRNEFERGENDPFDALLKQSFATAFREHPYHHPTIGWRADIESATIDKLRRFYDTFYHPDNATLILVGGYEREGALDLVERHFGASPRAPHVIDQRVTAEPAQEGERRFVIRRAGEVGWVSLAWRTPEAAHPDTYPLAVLADALTGGVTGRLYQRLVETGRCMDSHAFAWQLRDPGLLQVFAALNPGASHAEIEEAIRQEVAGIARDGLRDEELERAKVQVEAQTAYHRDSPAQIAAALAEAVAAVNWRFYLDYPHRIRAVTNEDVVRVAREVLLDDCVTAGWFVPRNGANGGARVAIGGPRPCCYTSRLSSQVVEADLPGGVRALLLPRRGQQSVHLQGSMLAGHALLDRSEWTAASLVPDMLERGTRGRDRLTIARTLEDRGIEFDVSGESLNPLEVFVGGRCLARHLDLVLALAVELLREPVFPAEELEKLRQLRLGELAHAQEDTFIRAFEAFSRLVYPAGHPHFRRDVGERRRDLESVGRDDLERAHRKLFGPASLVLALVGDFDPGEVAVRLETLLRGWAGGLPEPPEIPRTGFADTTPGESRDAMPDKPNLDVLLGQPGNLRRCDEDFLPAMLGNSVLGHSTLSSRLGRRLRDSEGLTYGVISRFFGAGLVDGPWAVTMSLSPANLDRGVAFAREEIARLVHEGPDEGELSDEREATAGSYRVGLAVPSGMARELARLARHRLPVSSLDTLPDQVLAITREAVAEALRRRIDPYRLTLAVAGSLVDPVSSRD